MLQHLHWFCWCCRSLLVKNENPGTLASCNYTKDLLPCIKVIGVTFSLIVTMLQTKFLLFRVHPLAFSNILQKDSKNVSMLVKFREYGFYGQWVNKIAHVKQNLPFRINPIYCVCVYLVAHETNLFIEQDLFTKFKILWFTLKCTIICSIEKKYSQVV